MTSTRCLDEAAELPYAVISAEITVELVSGVEPSAGGDIGL
jgi:hypothetical protein